jgi:hypothetical protein
MFQPSLARLKHVNYLYNSFPKRKAKIPVMKALTRATIIWLSEISVISLFPFQLIVA